MPVIKLKDENIVNLCTGPNATIQAKEYKEPKRQKVATVELPSALVVTRLIDLGSYL